MNSAFYPKNPMPEHYNELPQYEWYRPEVNALGLFSTDEAEQDHINHGGLLLRKKES